MGMHERLEIILASFCPLPKHTREQETMNDLITLPATARRQVDQLVSLNIGQMTAQARYLYGGVGGERPLPRINQRITHRLSATGASAWTTQPPHAGNNSLCFCWTTQAGIRYLVYFLHNRDWGSVCKVFQQQAAD